MRKLGWLSVLAAAITLSIYASSVSGQQPALPRPYGTPPPLEITAFGGKPVTYKAPRTPWGDPDLQGVWSSDDMDGVALAAGGGRGRGGAPAAAPAPAGPPPLYMDEKAFEARKQQVAAAAKRGDTTAESSFRFDFGRRAFPQTRLVVDPPDGRVPTLLPGLQARTMPRGTYTTGNAELHSWKDFSLYERCITRGIGGSILRVIYGNGNRIVQAPGVVAFSYEMLSDTRILHVDNRPHVNQKIGMYLGDARARWEGEELVVETTNLTDQTAFGVNGNGTQHSKAMKITERFRRVADDIVQYQATWDDPLTYSAPFTVSFPLTPLDGGYLLPYDCHEGNAAIEMTLKAERDEDKRLAEDLAKGIKRERRGVQDCGAGVGSQAVAGCTPGAAARGAGAGGRGGGRGGRGAAADTGEGTEEK
jgi:hypothetical protein